MAKFNLLDSGEDFTINNEKKEAREIKVAPVENKKTQPFVRTETIEDFPTENETEEKEEKTRKGKEQKPKKQKPGRPSFKEKGLKKRKQYTLTLLEDTYNQIMENATIEGVSFAKYIEKAAVEYMENHKHV